MSQSKIRRRLSLPTGTETLLLKAAMEHRRMTFALESLFQLWGYLPAETPMVDYFEVYRRLISESSTRDTYRSLDRNGEILMIRSDTTLFLAKQLGVHLRAEELPVRVYYDDQILRHEEEHDISKNEYRQAGVELVGVAGRDGDVEVLLLLIASLAAAGAGDAVIHVGTQRIITALHELGVPASESGALRESIRLRRRSALHEILESSLSADAYAAVESVVFTIYEDHAAVETAALPGPIRDAVADVLETIAIVSALEPGCAIRMDLTEQGSHDYYTGLAFSAYHRDADDAIARGGRYDALLAAFGFDAPSVGFSIYTRKIPRRSDETYRPAPRATGDSLKDRVGDAKRRRDAGEAVTL